MGTDAAVLARRWFEEVWGKRSDAAIEELSARDGVLYQADGVRVSLADWRRFRTELLAAIPDLSVTVEGVVARGDDAVVRWRMIGTHQGAILGVAPTGRPIDAHGMTWMRFHDGKIVEGWDGWNVGGLIQELSQPAAGKATATVPR